MRGAQDRWPDQRAGRASVPPSLPLREALMALNDSSTALLLVVDGDGRLVGSLSDGDVRRAILAGADLDDVVDRWAHAEPVTVPVGTDRAAILDLMRARDLPQIPEVDGDGRVVRLHLLKEIVGGQPLPCFAVILAGGLGTRLKAVTGDLPKPMVPVAGRPILERLVLHLVGSGVRDVVLAVGYGAEVIEEHFGDGRALGCRIQYVREHRPLGTAGPLGLVRDQIELPPDDEPLIVMNGDLVTSFSVRGLRDFHRTGGARLTVAITDYAHEVPFGVIGTDGSRVVEVEEKPTWRGSVNAGIYAVSRGALESVPTDREFPMTELLQACLQRRETVLAWPVTGSWHDIGRPKDLAAAQGL